MDDNERKSAKKKRKTKRRPKSEKGDGDGKIKSKLERQREMEKRLDDAKLQSRREGVVAEGQDDIRMDAKRWGNNEDVESTDQNEKFQDQVDEPLKDYGKHEGEKSDDLVSMAVFEKRLLEIQLQIESGKAGSEIDEEKTTTTNIQGQDEEEDEQLDIEIPQDSFSIFYVAKTTHEHLLPIAVFLMQISILSLILYNLLQTQGSPLDLTMNIPVDVPIEVTIAQYLACLVSVFTATDFTDGVFFLKRRILNEDDYLRLHDDNQRPPYSIKWEASNLMRMAEGLLVISVCFVFIVQSTTVIDLFLDFAGVAFVSELDDVAFRLADRGFLGVAAKRLADKVLMCKAHNEEKGEHRGMKIRKAARVVLFATIALVMWIGLSYFAREQDVLNWACKSVSLTIGEAKLVRYRSFSGTYILTGRRHAKRAVYVQEQGEGSAFLAYCEETNRWTVYNNPLHFDDDDYYDDDDDESSIEEEDDDDECVVGPCCNYFLVSVHMVPFSAASRTPLHNTSCIIILSKVK